jgi:endogenous inhibitor of DNA gyrase (YacG/DUF329 family)
MPERTRPAPSCPVCDKPVPPREKGQRGPQPFCSERCRQVDLGRWFTGAYAVPAEEEEPSANDDA